MAKKLHLAPDPERDGIQRNAKGFIIRGELLLTDYEWSAGITPDVKQLVNRRRECGLATAPKVTDVTIVELKARAPIRAKVEQADMSDTPLFGQGSLL